MDVVFEHTMAEIGQDASGLVPRARRSPPFALAALVVAAIPALWLWSFTIDDALISVRYARHVVDGVGYRFNAGGPSTDGVTPLPWPFLLWPLAHAAPLVVLARVKALGLSLWLGTAAAWGAAMGRCESPLAAKVAAIVGLARLGSSRGARSERDGDRARNVARDGRGAGTRAPARRERAGWARGEPAAGDVAVGARAVGDVRALRSAPHRVSHGGERDLCGSSLRGLRPPAPGGVRSPGASRAHGEAERSRAWRRLCRGRRPGFGRACDGVRAARRDEGEGTCASDRACGGCAPGRRRGRGRRLDAVRAPGRTNRAIAALSRRPLLDACGPPGSRSRGWAWRFCSELGPSSSPRRPAGTRGRTREELAARVTPLVAGLARVACADVGWVSAATEADIVDLAGATDPEESRRSVGAYSKRIDGALLLSKDVDAVLLFVRESDLPVERWREATFPRVVEAEAGARRPRGVPLHRRRLRPARLHGDRVLRAIKA